MILQSIRFESSCISKQIVEVDEGLMMNIIADGADIAVIIISLASMRALNAVTWMDDGHVLLKI